VPITEANPFKGRQYPGEVIVTAVRWYLRYPLAYEHVSELLRERGLSVTRQFESAPWRGRYQTSSIQPMRVLPLHAKDPAVTEADLIRAIGTGSFLL
jgi:hypothetical protein